MQFWICAIIENKYIFWNTQVRIVKADGTATSEAGGDKVGPVNFLQNSLFSQLDIFWNDLLVSTPTPTYPFKVGSQKYISSKFLFQKF